MEGGGRVGLGRIDLMVDGWMDGWPPCSEVQCSGAVQCKCSLVRQGKEVTELIRDGRLDWDWAVDWHWHWH